MKANQRWWNERAPLHARAPFYQIDELKNGVSLLDDFEVTEFEIGQAHSLVHLQCHIGTDTIAWARRGLHVTGLDFSQSAIDEATQIANACAIASRWVRAHVYDAVSALGETYDIVDTGKGALTWLHDIDRWAEVVTQLLNPDGRLYLVEFHPIAWTLDAENWSIVTDYFASEPVIEHEPQGSSAVPNVETRWNTTAQWQHTVGDIISAVAKAGLRLDWFHEFPFTRFALADNVERTYDGGIYYPPADTPRLPLMLSLCGTKISQ
ncbi:MAG: class I SAM-dependent methyltransferase [Ferrimicrobium sp.]|nr:class I SAM-dependent methyltransferase [Ferrimicrobium sp.]